MTTYLYGAMTYLYGAVTYPCDAVTYLYFAMTYLDGATTYLYGIITSHVDSSVEIGGYQWPSDEQGRPNNYRLHLCMVILWTCLNIKLAVVREVNIQTLTL